MEITISTSRIENLIRDELSSELRTRVHRIACEASSGFPRDVPGEYNNRLDFTNLSRLLGNIRELFGADYEISSLAEFQTLPGGKPGDIFSLPYAVRLDIPGRDSLLIRADWALVSGYDPINELVRLPDDLLTDPEWEKIRAELCGFWLESEPEDEDTRPVYSDERMLRVLRQIAASCRAGARTMPPTSPPASAVRRLRNMRGLTQKALSDASGVGLSQIQKLESGEIKVENLTLKNALALAAALGVEPKDLIGG